MCAQQKPEKSKQQALFEAIRHHVACKHQVPTHLTEWELKEILNMLTKQPIECGI